MRIKVLLLFGLMLLFTDCSKDELNTKLPEASLAIEESPVTDAVWTELRKSSLNKISLLETLTNTSSNGKNSNKQFEIDTERSISLTRPNGSAFLVHPIVRKSSKKDKVVSIFVALKAACCPEIKSFALDEGNIRSNKIGMDSQLQDIFFALLKHYQKKERGSSKNESLSDCIIPEGTLPAGLCYAIEPDEGADCGWRVAVEKCPNPIPPAQTTGPSTAPDYDYGYDYTDPYASGPYPPSANGYIAGGYPYSPADNFDAYTITGLDLSSMTIAQRSFWFQQQIEANGLENASIETLVSNTGFRQWVAQLLDKPAFVSFEKWVQSAALFYAGEYRKSLSNGCGNSLFCHGETITRMLSVWSAQQIEQISQQLSQVFQQVESYLPQNSQEWSDLAVAIGGFIPELAAELNPVTASAVALRDAWNAYDGGRYLESGLFLAAAISEFVPWAQVLNKIADVGKITIKGFKYFKVFKSVLNSVGDGFTYLLRNSELLSLSDEAIKLGLDAGDSIGDAIQTTGKIKPTWPEIKALFKRGNDFNKKGRLSYGPNRSEIHLGNGKRLDAYVPGEKIVSRKATDIEYIQESTWRKYCNELVTKYKIGTPVNSTKMPGAAPLSGKYFLEIPSSNISSSKLPRFRTIAREYGIEDVLLLAE